MINNCHFGDSRQITKSIEKESIDLIFTDPIYQNIEDYIWLGDTALNLLKDNKPLLVFCSKRNQHKVTTELEKLGLEYVWYLSVVVQSHSTRLVKYHIFTWGTCLLWFNKGNFAPCKWIPDTYITKERPKGNHKYNKNVENISYYLLPFSNEGDLVLDPFCGSGPILKSCQINKRNYIGIEKDFDTYISCKQRLENLTSSKDKIPIF